MKTSKLSYLFFLLPVLAAFTLIVMIPAVLGISYSFTDWNGIENTFSWIGIQHYQDILSTDRQFIYSFLYTTLYSLVTVVLVNIMGLSLAMLVTRNFKGRNALRSVYFMPNLIGGVLLGFSWNFIFTRVFANIAKATGMMWLNGWLSTTVTGFWGTVIVKAWQLSGYLMVIYIAQIQAIPASLLEASQIDGAGRWQTFRRITLPLLAPAFTIGLFLSLSQCFKMFDINLTLTGGGPYRSTEMLALNINQTAFAENNFGQAQAKAVIYLLVIVVISLFQLWMTKRKEVEM